MGSFSSISRVEIMIRSFRLSFTPLSLTCICCYLCAGKPNHKMSAAGSGGSGSGSGDGKSGASDIRSQYPIFAAVASANAGSGSAASDGAPKTVEIQDGPLTFVLDARIEAEMAADKRQQKAEFDAATQALAKAPKKKFASGVRFSAACSRSCYPESGERRRIVP